MVYHIRAELSNSEQFKVELSNSEQFKVELSNSEQFKAFMTDVISVGRDSYLKVTPEVIWLTEINNFTNVFNVRANVDWTVVGDIVINEVLSVLENITILSNDVQLSNSPIQEYLSLSNDILLKNSFKLKNGHNSILLVKLDNKSKIENMTNIINA